MLDPTERQLTGLDISLDEEESLVVTLAIGRLFRILSRPHQPGDLEEYERCRAVVMSHVILPPEYEPNWKAVQSD